MIRTFHPIGQGAFVTERFEEGQRIVYDCGTATSKWLIHDLVERDFAKGEVVNGVFISSLDFEHASGLEALLDRCRVERVFLPYLSEEEKAYTLLKYLCEGGAAEDLVGRLITEPKAALEKYRDPEQKFPLLALVAEETAKDKNPFDAKIPIRLLPPKAIAGFRLFVNEKMDWVYAPAVFRQAGRVAKLKEALSAKGVGEVCGTVKDLVQAWADLEVRKRIQEAYKSLKIPFCAVSMALYAGPEEIDYDLYEQFTEEGKWSYYARIRPGCIYTGNLQLPEKADRERWRHSFDTYAAHVGTLLLPGHGSQSLYQEEMLPKHNSIVVATADNENLTGEPHAPVIRNIMQHKIPFYLVTELPGSILQFYVSEEG